MSVREYVGARYVPIVVGEWDNNRTYEPLMVVTNEGNSYTSRQYVPAGIEITNESYWVLSANYNAQVEAYRKEVRDILPYDEAPTEGSAKGVTSDGIKKAIKKAIAKYNIVRISDIDSSNSLAKLENCILLIDSNYISNNDVINDSVMVIPDGGVISGSITINGPIYPILIKMFESNASITTNNVVGYPEWFGASANNDDNSVAINKCIATFNVTKLQNITYNIKSGIFINRSFAVIEGYIPSTNYDTPNTTIIKCDGSFNGIVIGAPENNYIYNNIYLRYFSIASTDTSATSDTYGIKSNMIRALYMYYVNAINFRKNFYFYGATNNYIEHCRSLHFGNNYSYACYGFYFDQDAPAMNGVISPTATVLVDKCESNNVGYGNVHGVHIAGRNGTSDIAIENCNFVANRTGIYIEGNDSVTQQDIIVANNVVDSCYIALEITKNVNVTVTGNWLSCTSNPTNVVEKMIFVHDSDTGSVTFTGNQLKEGNTNTDRCIAIRLFNANNIISNGNVILSCREPYLVDNCNSISFVDCVNFQLSDDREMTNVAHFENCHELYFSTICRTSGNKYAYGCVINSCRNVIVNASLIALSSISNSYRVYGDKSGYSNANECVTIEAIHPSIASRGNHTTIIGYSQND